MTVTFFAPVNAFCCFDQSDREFHLALDRHLAPLKHAGRIQIWDESQVLPGTLWERERDQQFSNARLLLLLISADFLASATGQQQIQMALLRQRRGDAVVIPVLLRHCVWEQTELRGMQMLPRDSHPLHTRANPDEAWQEVVTEISHILDRYWQTVVYLISAPEDRDLAQRLSQDMTRRRIAVCRLTGHQFQDEAVRNAMHQASAIVLIASPHASSSRIVRAQMDLALYDQCPFLVMRISGKDGGWFNSGGWRIEREWDGLAEGYETIKESLLAYVMRLSAIGLPPPNLKRPKAEQPKTVQKGRNPYKGLHPFTAQDTRDFFGRGDLIDKLATAVEDILTEESRGKQNVRLLTVLGASGSGKSSVILAGLLPHLQEGGVFSSREWIYLDPIVPGTHPLEGLAVSLAQLPSLGNVAFLQRELMSDSLRILHLLARQIVGRSSQKVVLFIDQFEEVFTLTVSEEERQHFFDLLITAVTEPRGPLLVVLTLRADFYDRLMQYQKLYCLLDAHRVSVLPMERDELRQVIEEPARLDDVQITFEDNLVGDLLFDMREQEGALPLLEFTLDLLFTYPRRDQMLTLHAYREIGGVKGALAQHAEATYKALTEEQQKLARGLFLRLIDPGRTEQDTTRRRAQHTEFELSDPTQQRLLDEAIGAFIAARLLTTNTNEHLGVVTIEVSHEALIRKWPRLTDWLQEAREDILLQQKISEDVIMWQQRGRPNDRLYRGSQLKEAKMWAKRNTPSQQERTFLHAGVKYRVLRFVVSVISIVLLLAATTGGAALFFTWQANPTLVTTPRDNVVGSLRWAILAAPSGATITFDSNMAGQTVELTDDILFFPKKSLIIQNQDPQKGITIHDANSGIVVAPGADITMSGLTFTGGPSNSSVLLNNFGTLTLKNCTVSDNKADSTVPGNKDSDQIIVGGGIINAGKLTMDNSNVKGNTTAGDGGGIFNYHGELNMINNSSVTGNTATGQGGGISNYHGKLSLTNSSISGNTASGEGGGGVFNFYGTLTLNNSSISNNTASGGSGGGVFNYYGKLDISNNNSISGNKDNTGYGGCYSNIYNTSNTILC